MEFKTRNVNTAFCDLVQAIASGQLSTHISASRYGEVAKVEEPVTLTYSHPMERVLFNASRDANPFFHLYEALWMLAGRADVEPLAYYNRRMREFSDDGVIFNGAYGARWRWAAAWDAEIVGMEEGTQVIEPGMPYNVDQLDVLVHHLRRDPYSRRAVLQMWTVEDDLLKINASKDVCCNLSACFAVEMGKCPKCLGTGYHRYYPDLNGEPNFSGSAACGYCGGMPHDRPALLNMTVFNRSNDLVWGLLGANAVHFSILLEYMAAKLDLDVGRYHHVTNDLHVYTNNWEPEKWAKDFSIGCYGVNPAKTPIFPLVCDPETFDKELKQFVEANKSGPEEISLGKAVWREPFLECVAQPMMDAFHFYRLRDFNQALRYTEAISAKDWRIAARNWLVRRRNKSQLNEEDHTSVDPDFAV